LQYDIINIKPKISALMLNMEMQKPPSDYFCLMKGLHKRCVY